MSFLFFRVCVLCAVHSTVPKNHLQSFDVFFFFIFLFGVWLVWYIILAFTIFQSTRKINFVIILYCPFRCKLCVKYPSARSTVCIHRKQILYFVQRVLYFSDVAFFSCGVAVYYRFCCFLSFFLFLANNNNNYTLIHFRSYIFKKFALQFSQRVVVALFSSLRFISHVFFTIRNIINNSSAKVQLFYIPLRC